MEGSAAPGWGRARSIRCGERRGGAESVIEGWGEVTASPGGEGGGGESGGGEGDCGLGDGAAGWAAVARTCGQKHRQQLQRACAGVTGLRQLARHIRLRPVHDTKVAQKAAATLMRTSARKLEAASLFAYTLVEMGKLESTLQGKDACGLPARGAELQDAPRMLQRNSGPLAQKMLQQPWTPVPR